jgi:hypothetical protein
LTWSVGYNIRDISLGGREDEQFFNIRDMAVPLIQPTGRGMRGGPRHFLLIPCGTLSGVKHENERKLDVHVWV